MTPTPNDLDALARETAEKLTSHYPSYYSESQVREVIRAALAQVVPTGELRAKVEALRDAALPGLSQFHGARDAHHKTLDAVLALLPAAGEPAPTCATCRHLLSKELAVCTRLEAPAISFGPLQDRKSTPPESFCCNWHDPKPTGGAQ